MIDELWFGLRSFIRIGVHWEKFAPEAQSALFKFNG